MEHTTADLVDHVFLRCVEDCFEPIMLTDFKGRLTYVNPAWVLTYGYTKEEAMGETPRLLRSVHQSEEFYKSMWQTILDPTIGFWKGEVTNRAKDGHLVPVLLTITPHRKSTGEIMGYMGIAVDLSEQKTLEQQVLQQDRLASVGMLAGGLAHEIGNPLGVIRGRTELVLSQVRGNEIAEKNLVTILGQIDRISGLIQSLLRVSREPEQVSLRKIELEEAVEEVLILTSEECRKAGIEVKNRISSSQILAGPSHLQQLLLNIIINSIHAIEEQRSKQNGSLVKHFIELSSRVLSDGRCELSVRDSGCGISLENRDKVFRPFFTTKSAGNGTGLGLAVVAKLVQEMNGKVSVLSDGPGKGAQFNFEFQTV